MRLVYLTDELYLSEMDEAMVALASSPFYCFYLNCKDGTEDGSLDLSLINVVAMTGLADSMGVYILLPIWVSSCGVAILLICPSFCNLFYWSTRRWLRGLMDRSASKHFRSNTLMMSFRF